MRAHVATSRKIFKKLGRSDFEMRYLELKSTLLVCERAIASEKISMGDGWEFCSLINPLRLRSSAGYVLQNAAFSL